jgi:hypothetical protein
MHRRALADQRPRDDCPAARTTNDRSRRRVPCSPPDCGQSEECRTAPGCPGRVRLGGRVAPRVRGGTPPPGAAPRGNPVTRCERQDSKPDDERPEIDGARGVPGNQGGQQVGTTNRWWARLVRWNARARPSIPAVVAPQQRRRAQNRNRYDVRGEPHSRRHRPLDEDSPGLLPPATATSVGFSPTQKSLSWLPCEPSPPSTTSFASSKNAMMFRRGAWTLLESAETKSSTVPYGWQSSNDSSSH